MISYASTKAFINTFATSLRVLAGPFNVDVVCVQPGFIGMPLHRLTPRFVMSFSLFVPDTRLTSKMRQQGSTVPSMEFASAEGLAVQMKHGVEHGGVGVITWPTRQAVVMYGLGSTCL